MKHPPIHWKKLERWDKKYLWHPFTQMKGWQEEELLLIERGKGASLYDVQGRKYLDGVSSLWCNLHGHRHPALDQALRQQLRKIAHSTLLGLAHEPSILLARELVRLAPKGLTRVFYSDNGSTAVEVALKMAFQYWQLQGQPKKKKFVRFVHAYHGDTLGSVSVGGMDLFHRTYSSLLFPTLSVRSPYCYRCPLGHKTSGTCPIDRLQEVEKLLRTRAGEVAAVIIEPLIQGAAGMIAQPPGFVKHLEKLCRRYNVLLICDEVATGFGRTGRLFACDHESVQPDFLCLAKGLTGGYLPLSATLTTETVFKAFLGEYREAKTFFHGHTYTGNPLACAVALANLRLFREGKVLPHVQKMIRLLSRELLARRFASLPHVGDIRHVGLMVGLELVRDKARKTPYDFEERIGHRVILEARRRGVILRPLGNVVVLLPPLCITEKELLHLLNVTYRSIQTVTERE